MKRASPLEGWLKYEVKFKLQEKLQNNKERRLPRHIHVDEYYASKCPSLRGVLCKSIALGTDNVFRSTAKAVIACGDQSAHVRDSY
jgi:hypothetical protein